MTGYKEYGSVKGHGTESMALVKAIGLAGHPITSIRLNMSVKECITVTIKRVVTPEEFKTYAQELAKAVKENK